MKDKRTDTQVNADDELAATNYLLFNVLKERHVFFSGLVWKPHLCVLELIEGGNLWSLTI